MQDELNQILQNNCTIPQIFSADLDRGLNHKQRGDRGLNFTHSQMNEKLQFKKISVYFPLHK